ncbi:hypothetical protein FNL55_14775 [Tardiphaga sp. vice352]|uniref:hypothetical protein n=1 Tax=unclassified Tardiphaga TaxID=2631404 RepID=UPI001164CAF7|nr:MULTISPECIES: hypothetical protein [unclassified Tardiphaga]QDM17115.1 hypothetical protein FNL53_15060 [Tardiphaga sp. vice278]QDM27349.1 hypothetical protein FNL56_15370 [Tardiphaga sp. vice304]QDM32475.1 hypothetical protein FNL55_14775 [Tardiphaga sp. vice352]
MLDLPFANVRRFRDLIFRARLGNTRRIFDLPLDYVRRDGEFIGNAHQVVLVCLHGANFVYRGQKFSSEGSAGGLTVGIVKIVDRRNLFIVKKASSIAERTRHCKQVLRARHVRFTVVPQMNLTTPTVMSSQSSNAFRFWRDIKAWACTEMLGYVSKRRKAISLIQIQHLTDLPCPLVTDGPGLGR